MGGHSKKTLSTGFAVAALTCSLCAGVAAASTLPPSAQALIGQGVVYDDTNPNNTAPDAFVGLSDGTVMVVTPGTDDTTLHPRIDSIVGTRTVLVVNYPQSFAPIISGKSGAVLPLFAPSYTASKDKAVQGNLTVMEAFKDDPNVTYAVYTGYSQGAEALGDAVAKAWATGKIDPDKSLVILVSDPRGPWGVKQGVNKIPLFGPAVQTVLGVEPNGARNPADTGSVPVYQLVVTADPVGNWQWRWDRPVSSLLVDMAGFISCHSDPACYGGDLNAKYGAPTLYKSVDGNTTYMVYKSAHPLTLLTEQIYTKLGLRYTEADVARWQEAYQAFYPISEPTPDNAAVPVAPYSVTMPAAVATGASTPVASSEAPVTSVSNQPDEATPVVTSASSTASEPSSGSGSQPETTPAPQQAPQAGSMSTSSAPEPESSPAVSDVSPNSPTSSQGVSDSPTTSASSTSSAGGSEGTNGSADQGSSTPTRSTVSSVAPAA